MGKIETIISKGHFREYLFERLALAAYLESSQSSFSEGHFGGVVGREGEHVPVAQLTLAAITEGIDDALVGDSQAVMLACSAVDELIGCTALHLRKMIVT